MSGLTRKNLMVDAEALRTLARQRGTSESRAVRDAVQRELALEGMVAALEQLRELGFFDHLGQMYGLAEDEVGQIAEAEASGA